MKKTLLVLAILIGAAFSCFAQDYDSSPKISVGFDLGITTGPLSGPYPAAGNFRFKFENPINDSPVSLILTTGFTFYVSKDGNEGGLYYDDYDNNINGYHSVVPSVPLEIGARIYAYKKFYIEGNVGASFNISNYHDYYNGKTVAFMYSPIIGYAIPIGRSGRYGVDVKLGYENRVEPGGGFAQVMAGAAFNLGL